jgi:RNA polymerase sigma-70 factor, ECF subfamily
MVIREDSDDDQLMALAAAGNRAAFDVIVRRHQHRLQRFATRMLGGDSSLGADISVGTLLRLWEHRAVYRPCGQLESWLLRTTYRQCLDLLATNRSVAIDSFLVEQSDLASPSPSGRIEGQALAEAVRTAVMELPETHRAVLVLSTYEGLAYDAIARTLDIPAGTVASRRNHALAMLRRRLAAWENP